MKSVVLLALLGSVASQDKEYDSCSEENPCNTLKNLICGKYYEYDTENQGEEPVQQCIQKQRCGEHGAIPDKRRGDYEWVCHWGEDGNPDPGLDGATCC